MIYSLKDTVTDFVLPLLELSEFAVHGYLFKLESDSNASDASYHIPTVVSEDLRYTYFEYDFAIPAGQYKYSVYEFDSTLPEPENESGLTLISVGILKVIETETNNIYL